MNLWTIVAIILFLVIRSVSRTKEQIQRNNREKEKSGAAPSPGQGIDWETFFSLKEEPLPEAAAAVKATTPKKEVVQERPVLPATPAPSFQKPEADTAYKETGEESDDSSWFAGSDDLRRAVVNNEILSRKFDL